MRVGRVLSISLLLSLAVNLFLAGMLVSQWLIVGPQRHERPRPPFDRMAAQAALSEPYRAVVDGIWAEHHQALRGKRKEIFALRRAIREHLVAETLDPVAFDHAYRALHATSLDRRSALHATLTKIATTLPLEDRRRYFKAGLPGHRGGPLRRMMHDAPPSLADPPAGRPAPR
jgi:uncharacterized membrane protein